MARGKLAIGLLAVGVSVLLAQPLWAVQGGCCLPDGSCQDSTRDDVCADLGGIKPNNPTDPCSAVECPAGEGGACSETPDCFPGTGLECVDGLCARRTMAPVASTTGLLLLVGALGVGGGIVARRRKS